MLEASFTRATSRMRPPHEGQTVTSIENVRARSSMNGRYWQRCDEVPPGFSGVLFVVASGDGAGTNGCGMTCDRHFDAAANTPE